MSKHPRKPSFHSKKGMLVDSTMTSLGTMLKNKKNLMRNSAIAVNNIKRDIINVQIHVFLKKLNKNSSFVLSETLRSS
jgi:hypothetical protein